MRFNTSLIALAALALCSALPAAAQTSMTIEAEGMTRSNYALEGSLIRVASMSSPGTATQTFSGAAGTYNLQVYVQLENDGQSTLEVYKGSTLLRKYTYPLGTSLTSFTVSNVALASGDTIRLVGRAQAGAVARVDRMVLTQVAAATPTPTSPTTTTPTTTTPTTTTPTTTTPTTTTPTTGSALTMQAEGMTRSNYALEGSLIRVASFSSPGTATQNFSGASGTYNVQVYVQLENDGQPTLEIYKGATLLRRYTYPLGTSLTSFTISSVALASGETIKLVGRAQGGAVARVDKLVFQPVAASTTNTPTSPTTTTPTTTTPTTTTPTTTTPTTTTPTSGSALTMQAEGMTRSNYALEGNLIRVASFSSPGTATQNFSGASGTYNVQVYVQLENDGQPTLEVYKGATLLRRYTYPLGTSLTSFTISSVALASGETIKLVGRAQGGAVARVDKLVFQPLATSTPTTNTPPSVAFKAPAAGATLSGTVNSTGCEASASDSNGSVAKVDFYLGTTPLGSSKTAAPYQCAIETTKFANGTHTLMAVATDNLGATTSAQRSVTIDNSGSGSNVGGGTGGTSSIAASHIITRASADSPFAEQNGYIAQAIGTSIQAASVPESGINGSMLPNGETLRFGKVSDPMNSLRKGLSFQVHKSDPDTSGAKRTELSVTPNIEMNKVYWIAFSAYVYDWGTLSSSDQALFGTQLHQGNKGLHVGGPAFSLYTTQGGRRFRLQTRWSTSSSPSLSNAVSAYYADHPIPFGRWADFVFKFRENTNGNGFVQVWMDGNEIAHHQGNLGYNTGYTDYVKFGYYNWNASSMSSTARKVLLRSPTIVADPTGQTYTAEQLRALIAPPSGSTTAGTSSGTSTTITAGSTDGVCSTAQCVLTQ
jgi:hypothetical protein